MAQRTPSTHRAAWEYHVLDVGALPAEDAQNALNELSGKLWELVWVDGGRAYLKRAVAEPPKPGRPGTPAVGGDRPPYQGR